MIRKLTLATVLFLLSSIIFPSEGLVSQVMNKEVSLETVLGLTTDIVMARDLRKTKVFRSVTFPKSTHHAKSSETKYQEEVDVFEITEIINSKKLKVGQEIEVWIRPSYPEGATKRAHEQGVPRSVIVPRYATKETPSIDSTILFLRPYSGPEATPNVWENVYAAREGKSMKEKLTKTTLNPTTVRLPPTTRPTEKK
jgi:hypothetical protein